MVLHNIVEICVAIDIALLTIAYPISINKVSSIGEKYSSNYLLGLFLEEWPEKSICKKKSVRFLEFIFLITLLSFLGLIFHCEPLFGWDNWFINNSAKFMVLICTGGLVIVFYRWFRTIVLYTGNPTKLLPYLIEKYKKRIEKNKKSIDKNKDVVENDYLLTIYEFAHYATKVQNVHLGETLLKFYFGRIEVNGEGLLLDDGKEIPISEASYSWLWANLLIIAEHPTFVQKYWEKASKYSQSNPTITLTLDIDSKIKEVGIDKAMKQRDEKLKRKEIRRNRFLEFHYALGGLLLYKKQYHTLRYIFTFTNSQPPVYPLLPQDMFDIFFWFENFSNKYNLEFKYRFSEFQHLGNDYELVHNISSYIVLLFIILFRQYPLGYAFRDIVEQPKPKLPDNYNKLSKWLSSIPRFKKYLENILKQKDLIEILGYTDIVEKHREDFYTFIDALQERIKVERTNAPISQDKVRKFNESTKKIITDAFNEYKGIFIPKKPDEQYVESITIIGKYCSFCKDDFVKDSPIAKPDYHTTLAESIACGNIDNIKSKIPYSFWNAYAGYVLNGDNVIEGLEKLINTNKDLVIVAFDIDADLLKQIEGKFPNNSIRKIPSSKPELRNIYVLHKDDLPSITHEDLKDLNKKEIEENQLTLISDASNPDEPKIYTSVIDINKEENKSIRQKYVNHPSQDDLQVLVMIEFVSKIWWRENPEVVQISIASPYKYKEEGIQNTIADIQPFGKKRK